MASCSRQPSSTVAAPLPRAATALAWPCRWPLAAPGWGAPSVLLAGAVPRWPPSLVWARWRVGRR
eukprot:8507399-Alexandrium_andersonii.AAC.1